jgi:hypothetical protein
MGKSNNGSAIVFLAVLWIGVLGFMAHGVYQGVIHMTNPPMTNVEELMRANP